MSEQQPDIDKTIQQKQQVDGVKRAKQFKRYLKQELVVFFGFGVLWIFFASFPMILTKSFYFYSPVWWQNFLFLVGPYTVYLLCVGFGRLYRALSLASDLSMNPEAPLEARFWSTEFSFFVIFWLAWSLFFSIPMWLLHFIFRENDWIHNILIFTAPGWIYLIGRILMLLFTCIVSSPEAVMKEYDVKSEEK